jgi:hypothetical protein
MNMYIYKLVKKLSPFIPVSELLVGIKFFNHFEKRILQKKGRKGWIIVPEL